MPCKSFKIASFNLFEKKAVKERHGVGVGPELILTFPVLIFPYKLNTHQHSTANSFVCIYGESPLNMCPVTNFLSK